MKVKTLIYFYKCNWSMDDVFLKHPKFATLKALFCLVSKILKVTCYYSNGIILVDLGLGTSFDLRTSKRPFK